MLLPGGWQRRNMSKLSRSLTTVFMRLRSHLRWHMCEGAIGAGGDAGGQVQDTCVTKVSHLDQEPAT
jgi:hypothetical protein